MIIEGRESNGSRIDTDTDTDEIIIDSATRQIQT